MGEVILFLIPPFVACVCILTLLGYLGIHVLQREIIFIDIALAQIAAVGATCAHVFLRADENSLLAYLCAFGCTVIASFFFSQIDRRIRRFHMKPSLVYLMRLQLLRRCLFLDPQVKVFCLIMINDVS